VINEGLGALTVGGGSGWALKVRYVSVVAEGLSAKQEICRQVEDHRIDLLLLGTRGLGTLTKYAPLPPDSLSAPARYSYGALTHPPPR
jgi:hypothetical protein